MHHDHITGNYIDSACNNCNLKFKYKKPIPIYIYNLKEYNGHFFSSDLNAYVYEEDNIISCISSTNEKYISF